MIPHIRPDGLPTPTVRELYERKEGLAEAVEFNKRMEPTVFRLTDKGWALLGEIMRTNAQETLARHGGPEEAVARMKRKAEE